MGMRWDVILLVSVITSLGSVMMIVEEAPTVMRGALAFWVQVSHDYVCLMMPYAVGTSIIGAGDRRLVFLVNAAYTLVMACFSYYKRCVLTLWFNDLIMIDKCHRYIPVWQRIINKTTRIYEIGTMCDYRSAYLWLNDQILFSLMIMLMNLNEWQRNKPTPLVKKPRLS